MSNSWLDGWMEKLPAATSQPCDQADKKQHDENEKQDLRDTGSPGGDTTKAQQCRDNGDYEKYDGVIQHGDSPLGEYWVGCSALQTLLITSRCNA